jgi:RNA polymerase sigma-70 factor (ECF subfamily)
MKTMLGGPSSATTPERPKAAGAPTASTDDIELVERAQAGDSAAFGELVDRNSSMLRRLLFRITRNCEAAWDAMQEALVSAWRNIGRFEGRSKFSTWLTRIGINEVHRGRRRSGVETVELEDSLGERVPDWGGRPDEVFESHEFLDAVERGLDSLQPDHRAAVVLRDVEGFSTREAARMTGVGERAFKSRLHRGRMGLRAELDAYFVEGYVR